MSHYSGTTILDTARYGHWAPLVNQWQDAHQTFVAATGDAAYWYTERSNVGILAAGAWKMDLVALEEYQVEKSHSEPDSPETSKNWKGRCDLWIYGKKFNEIIEAKQNWVQILSPRAVKRAEKTLESAAKDARDTSGKDVELGTGIAFLLPYVSVESTSPRALRSDLAALIERLHACQAGLIAWSFPHQARAFKGTGEKNYIPGVIMLVPAASDA